MKELSGLTYPALGDVTSFFEASEPASESAKSLAAFFAFTSIRPPEISVVAAVPAAWSDAWPT